MCYELDKNRKGKQLFLFHLPLPMFTDLLVSVFHIYCIFPTALIVTVFFTTANFLYPEFCPLLLFWVFLYSFHFFLMLACFPHLCMFYSQAILTPYSCFLMAIASYILWGSETVSHFNTKFCCVSHSGSVSKAHGYSFFLFFCSI